MCWPIVRCGVPVSLNETGVQTDSSRRSGYHGSEVSATAAGGVRDRWATEEYQATWYRRMLDLVACDPNVAVVNIFHLIDEAGLAGWQSGLYFADALPKRSAQVVRDWLASTSGRCGGKTAGWRPPAPLTPVAASAQRAKTRPAAPANASAKASEKATKATRRQR